MDELQNEGKRDKLLAARVREKEIHKLIGRIAQTASSTELGAIVDMNMGKDLAQEILCSELCSEEDAGMLVIMHRGAELLQRGNVVG